MSKKKKYKKQPKDLVEIQNISFEQLTDGFHKEIISLFHHISQPFDNGKGEKEARMMKLLAPYGAIYEEDLGIRVPAIDEAKFVVVSHIDLIPLFNKGFAKNEVYSLGIIDEKEIISGALDNTFTNAVVMHSIFELRQQGLAKDVEFIFTEEEETTSAGIKTYLRKYGNKPFFINLDVTNDGQGSHMSIEYDEPNWGICKQINREFNASFTIDRVGDDMDAIIQAKGKGYSYCIPTWKTIHSYRNYTFIENIIPYYQGLLWMLTEMDVTEKEQDIKYLSINKALKIEKYEKLVKKEAKAKNKKKTFSGYSRNDYYPRDSGYYHRDSGYYGHRDSIFSSKGSFDNDFEIQEEFGSEHTNQTYFDYGSGILNESDYLKSLEGNFDSLDEEDIVSTKNIRNLDEVVKSAIIIAEQCEIVNKNLDSFVHNTVYSQEQWILEDLIEATGLSLDESLTFVGLLDDYFCLETIEPGVYKFPRICKVKP